MNLATLVRWRQIENDAEALAAFTREQWPTELAAVEHAEQRLTDARRVLAEARTPLQTAGYDVTAAKTTANADPTLANMRALAAAQTRHREAAEVVAFAEGVVRGRESDLHTAQQALETTIRNARASALSRAEFRSAVRDRLVELARLEAMQFELVAQVQSVAEQFATAAGTDHNVDFYRDHGYGTFTYQVGPKNVVDVRVSEVVHEAMAVADHIRERRGIKPFPVCAHYVGETAHVNELGNPLGFVERTLEPVVSDLESDVERRSVPSAVALVTEAMPNTEARQSAAN